MEKEPILQMVSDIMILRYVYEKPFTVRLPDRSEWEEGFQPDRKGGLISYTDVSKTNKSHPAIYKSYDIYKNLQKGKNKNNSTTTKLYSVT
jgi:hypothetical protein